MLNVKSFCHLVVLSLVVFVSSSAFAGFSDTFGPDVPNFTQTVTLDKYTGSDPLTDVKITLSLISYDGQFEFDNDSSSPATVVIDLDVQATLNSTDVTLPVATSLIDVYDQTVHLAANDGDNKRAINAGGADYSSLNTGVSSSSAAWNISPANISEYVGSGTFDISVDISELLTITGNSGVSMAVIPTLVEGVITVEYIPEPATIAILAFGGFVLRKRKA